MMSLFRRPITISLLIGFVAFIGIRLDRLGLARFDDLIDASINVSGILLGFLITLHGILLSMKDGAAMKAIKKNGYDTDLTDYLKWAIKSSSMMLLYSLLLLIVDFDKLFRPYSVGQDVLLAVWILLATWMSICSYKFVSVFLKIVAIE